MNNRLEDSKIETIINAFVNCENIPKLSKEINVSEPICNKYIQLYLGTKINTTIKTIPATWTTDC